MKIFLKKFTYRESEGRVRFIPRRSNAGRGNVIIARIHVCRYNRIISRVKSRETRAKARAERDCVGEFQLSENELLKQLTRHPRDLAREFEIIVVFETSRERSAPHSNFHSDSD